MFSLYLAALIFGLGTFAMQMLFSSDADGDAHADAPHELNAGPDLDAAGDLDGGGELHGEAHSAGHGAHDHAAHDAGAVAGTSVLDWASVLLSLRFYVFASIAFGTVGAPITLLGVAAPGTTLAVSGVTALVVGLGASLAFRVLGQQTLSSGGTRRDLVGQVGRVLIPCEKGRRGKVRVRVRGQLIDYVAITDGDRLEAGSGVIVQEVAGEQVVVCRAPDELLLE